VNFLLFVFYSILSFDTPGGANLMVCWHWRGNLSALAFCLFLLQVGWRPEDLKAVVKSPRNVAYVENTIRKLEQGDLKLRVRCFT